MTEAFPGVQADLVAEEIQVGHGSGLIPLTAVRTRGQRELVVRHSRLQATTSEQHREITDTMKGTVGFFFKLQLILPHTNTAIKADV